MEEPAGAHDKARVVEKGKDKENCPNGGTLGVVACKGKKKSEKAEVGVLQAAAPM